MTTQIKERSPELVDQLENLRSQILELDRGIIELLAARFKVVEKVGELKKENNIPPLDKNQWLRVLETRRVMARELDVNEDLIEKILESIHEESLRIEK